MNSSKMAHQVSNFVREVRKQHVGKGPEHVTTRFLDAWAICELKGNLTTVERFAVNTEEGKRMVRELRTTYIKKVYEDAATRSEIERIVGAKLVTLLSDFDVDLDLAVTVFVFDRPLLVVEVDEV
ncbi:DUF2294 domain-containing protein [Ferroacidibacillus organovorans]|uniref:Na+-translocating membrane potential-generating system MpsC domain-containing protein n=1 Tax=Ferroacidibacillus organovorans TaxID=1765683 RepID=A0A162U1Z3_9BACL|nr:Na-translocating system protein MpsC family protein [Ferroacidibacillus organovorans]KYP81339.1 hypothetical protein AYJ22_00805 [Ferroacidibacillus organovorans]OAG95126.1 hypothetical protein AYW79_01405 [Ferroacidibacillus organovorans]OPG15114.1 hypothetical protein B2M26_13260 [Ferroacidibacillus organovorans]